VRFGVKVDRIDRVADGWRLATSTGEWTARKVIVATGHERAEGPFGRLASLRGGFDLDLDEWPVSRLRLNRKDVSTLQAVA
jgi:glycine/D-amino acid oxidase-like deaminating enzyme